jgi:hypothetical protein
MTSVLIRSRRSIPAKCLVEGRGVAEVAGPHLCAARAGIGPLGRIARDEHDDARLHRLEQRLGGEAAEVSRCSCDADGHCEYVYLDSYAWQLRIRGDRSCADRPARRPV